MTKEQAIEILKSWKNGGGFKNHIYKALIQADFSNQDKLHDAFPKLIDAYCIYAYGKDWADYYCDRHPLKTKERV